MEENGKTFVRKLKGEAMWNLEGSINEIWNREANVIKSEAVDIVEENKVSLPQNKDM